MPIVTISRGTLSGGEALATCLAEKAGYPSIGLEVIKDAATHYGISETAISQQLKQGPSVMERLLGEKRRIYLIAVQAALAERAQKGDFIYHGLAGHFLLQGVPNVFKVRLVAPLAYRVKSVIERKKLTEDEAVRYIEKVDEKRKQWTRFLYDVDITDPILYDAVINLENMSLDTACGMITYALSQPEFRDTPEKHQAIEDFSLACQVKATLALNERTKGIDLEVEAKAGNVFIQGRLLTTVVPFATGIRITRAEITEIAKSIPGVKEVKLELQEAPMAVE